MIRVDWGDHEEQLIIWRFEGTWTADDYLWAVSESEYLAGQKPHVVDIMADVRRATYSPMHIFTLMASSLQRKPSNLRMVVIVSHNPIHKLQVGLFERYYERWGDGLQVTSSVDEAYAMVEHTHNYA